MKLRKPWMIKLAARLGAGFMRLWMSTVRCRIDSLGQPTNPWDPKLSEHVIYVLWHENLLCIPTLHCAAPITALISHSSDGELLNQICSSYGMNVVRGSSSNGGMEAVDQLVEVSKRSHLLIAPDGPRGPRREVKRGLVYLAAWTRLRIVPMGVAFSRAWHAKSWDRTAAPCPFSRISIVAGPMIQVPAGVGKAGMEDYRLQIQQSLNTATDLAESWSANRIATPHWPTTSTSAA